MKRRASHLFFLLMTFLSLTFFSGCNLFSSLDSPDGDQQILAAARACFDSGDIACAKEYYSKLSNSSAETGAAESAFALLDQAGVTMAAIMESLSDGNGAKGLTNLAGILSTSSPGPEKRAMIFEAFKKIDSINTNVELRGLVRFLTSFGYAAAILAEDTKVSGDPNVFDKTDLVSDPSNCDKDKALFAGCTKPAGSVIDQEGSATTKALSTITASEAAVTRPTLGLFNGAIQEIETALSNELASGGKFGSGTGDFAEVMKDSPVDQEQVYRGALLSQGVGI